ncbi:sugar phosphate isomerase/epimerase [Kamptonema cortianum]|nr:sugar phosphate isomerase/epimerase [Kamptonema cortianum]
MNASHSDIRIGTLVFGNDKTAEYIRQILPHGFESFSVMFWLHDGGLNLSQHASEIRSALGDSGAVISSVSVFGNPLETDEEAELCRRSLRAAIDHAADYGCDLVSGFTGRLRGKPIHECVARFREVWMPLAERAKEKNVRIAFENCNAGGDWNAGDFNLALNPQAWGLLFEAIPLDNLGLEWEPCHQLLALADPIPQLQEWMPRIFHVHGKDATVDWPRIRKHGIFCAPDNDDTRKISGLRPRAFAHHRTPGFGDSNWTDIISELRIGGFKGSIDIEGWHDPVYRGDLEITGQVHALNHLKQCRGGAFVLNPRV